MPKHKVILVLLDGLNFEVARDCMGFLKAMTDEGLGTMHQLQSELPSLSRPLYECLLTGDKPVKSGIVHNHVERLSTGQSIFSLASQAGLVTAASAYHWVSELYNHAPYDPLLDRMVNDPNKNIAHGIFYMWDDYPDEAVFIDADYLRRTYRPDFLFVHPMNIDDAGHHAGFDSAQYRNTVRKTDVFISTYLQQWLADGYQVIITADHGMNNDRTHGGSLDSERQVPCYFFGDAFEVKADAQIPQTTIAGLCCELLGLEHHKPLPTGVLRG